MNDRAHSLHAEAVDDFITEVVQSHRAGPCRMVRTSGVDAPDEWARYAWRYESATGEELLSGVDTVRLTPSGKIDAIVVFAGPLV
ncbi:hypothetical protein [Streptosporangium pseudovulgare]|uniref:Nuclear transport factor 2 family protein n=1 Tax=Streptosporangium pseudovulgare TaxID=35765 RepID=A0ABQ2QXU3_9ACTN|nr:hypothetical protein [Streptosporangium pseudovulgare]GGQ03377.1 hypothetical protein GCM10010140_37120 [Streptosporangium pseudovulgare]